MPIFLALFAVPLLEIATFIAVGGQIGIAATLLLTLATALAGTALLRRQGLATIGRIRADLAADRLPARPLADGAMIAVAGILLLTPGFITDAVGLLLFVPAFRDLIWRQGARRLDVRIVRSEANGPRQHPRPPRAGPGVIDLDTGDYATRPDADSPWRGPDGQ